MVSISLCLPKRSINLGFNHKKSKQMIGASAYSFIWVKGVFNGLQLFNISQNIKRLDGGVCSKVKRVMRMALLSQFPYGNPVTRLTS